MEKPITELYQKDEPSRLMKRANYWRAAAAFVAVLTLAVCVNFVCTLDRNSFSKKLFSAVIASTLGGWAVISLLHFGSGDMKNEARHAKAVLGSPRETIEGKLVLTNERVYIKKGVTMRKVLIELDGRPVKSLQLNERKLKLVESRETTKVVSSSGFVAAFEE